MSKYKHIIWDWNGTLLDDVSTSIESMNILLKKRNLELMDRNRYISVFDFPVKDYYLKLGYDFSKEPFESISDEFMEQYSSKCFACKLHDGVGTVMAEIDSLGIGQSILTASPQDYIEKCVSFYGIDKYIGRVAGLDNTHAHGKIDNGKKLIKNLPYKPDEILLIGDTVHDYEVAKEIGCHCVLVSCGHHPEEKLKATGVEVVGSLNEVLDLIRNK